MSAPTPAPSPPEAAARPASRYSMGSYGNMVRSLLVILAMVGALVAIVPRIDRVDPPAVDAAAVAGQAGRQTGLPLSVPVGLPEGWKATTARYGPSTDDLPTWMAGWQTPSGTFVAIRQTKTATPGWVQAATAQGVEQGTVDVDGTTWSKQYSRQRGQTSLVDVPTATGPGHDVATVVTGTAGLGEIEQFVRALQPAATAG